MVGTVLAQTGTDRCRKSPCELLLILELGSTTELCEYVDDSGARPEGFVRSTTIGYFQLSPSTEIETPSAWKSSPTPGPTSSES